MKTRRITNDEVNTNFGEPGVDGAHRFPHSVAHKLQLPTCQQQSETSAVLISRLALIRDSNVSFCDSSLGNWPDPLQRKRSSQQLSRGLSAERLNPIVSTS
jgi:hypothetical protein